MPVTLGDLVIVPFNPEEHDVSEFDCGDDDLNDFLKTDAVKFQADHLSHTRVVFLREELVGFITLLADCIILQTREKKRALNEAREYHQEVYTFPAIKIGRIAICRRYQKSGIGKQLLIYTIGLVYRINKELNVGCRFITLDAYPQSVSWYQENHFVFNKHYEPKSPLKTVRPRWEAVKAFGKTLFSKEKKTHPSMRYDILRSPMIE